MDVCRCLIVFHVLAFTLFKVAACSEGTIIGGKDVKKPQPWMVSIQMKQRHVCGGILIQNQWVLTAAHCEIEPIESVKVLIGSLSLSHTQRGSQYVGILSYERSKTFSRRNKQDDIMLIKLDKKVKAKPKQIPKKQKDYPPGTKCVVTGWGITDLNVNVPKPSDKLQKLEVTVVGRDECNRLYKNKRVITRDMMCAGNEEENRGVCNGDSGGPLECNKNIAGLVSGSDGCGDPNKPTVFTFLSKRHIFWINSILKKQLNSTTF